MIVAVDTLPEIPFIEARHYTRGRLRPSTQAITLHCTDGSEGYTSAEACAHMFQVGWDDPKQWRSANEAIDTNSIVQCVPELRRAYHCGHDGNDRTYGIELCGRASQTHEQWLDEKSLPMLNLAAARVAERCKRFALPVLYVDYLGLRAGKRGITTHDDVSRAWKQSTHHDPGPGFPLDDFIEAVRIAHAKLIA